MTGPRWPRYAAAAVGVLWYLRLGGLHTLNPLNLNWVLSGDWRQHLFGWLFFRREPWTFPLGAVSALLHPVGSNIAFTDSNPLVSILLKPFAGWLPAEFQFIGPWLAMCFAMQGYWGARLTSTVTDAPVQQWLGGCLFAFSPVLAMRLGHDTLCAQWLLLGLMFVGFREYTRPADATRGARLALSLATLSAAIHPYLAAMCAALALACYVRLWRGGVLSLARVLAWSAATVAAMFTVMAVIGYFTDANPGSVGFERYAADLVTLIDAEGSSKLLGSFQLQEGRWEGFGFLGLGVLIALLTVPVAWLRIRPMSRRGVWIIAIVCLLMGVYSLSSTITLADRHVARIHHLYDWLDIITKPFRSSGRFIWPLHYVLTLLALWGVTRLFRRRSAVFATAALAIVVAVQAIDYRPQGALLADKNFREGPTRDLAVAKGRYRHLAMYPTQVLGACGGEYEEDQVYRYMLQAYRLNTTFNSGIYARVPHDRVQRACGDFYRAVDAGHLDRDTIYVVSQWSIAQVKTFAACGRFDGDWICVSRDSDPVFRTYVETGTVPK
jgi:hypothetical protein